MASERGQGRGGQRVDWREIMELHTIWMMGLLTVIVLTLAFAIIVTTLRT